MAYKSKYYVPKRSEYRQNYLPFDYYDFWITAKENENLRFKNKLRDYLHTPFDWDEDQDYYLEQSYTDLKKFDQSNQGTQTSERPNRHDHMKFVQEPEEQKKKNAVVQVVDPKKETLKIAKPKRARSAKPAANKPVKAEHNKPKTKNESNLLKNKRFTASLSNMAVQTPTAWQLRDFKNTRPVSKPLRSASVSNFQQKRPPFANYGWATKTKDLSIKPTHNALANKVLANHNDEDAILELTLHKLKKEASSVANEYSVIDSRAAEHFQNFRSDSRAWNSEYDEKYPDYSKSILKKDLYFQANPNRLTKSSLISSYAPLKRGPRSAKKKIYYLE